MTQALDPSLLPTPPKAHAEGAPPPQRVSFVCRDGVVLHGQLWPPQTAPETAVRGQVIINPATGVLARYYHRYAAFLASHGFEVLTWDYRGIGLSRPARLQGCGYRWRDWGMQDFTAALAWMAARPRGGPLMVVGHSIGGFLPGLAEGAARIDRMLTMGAQFAWVGDYAARKRLGMLCKWHVVMPLLSMICGYFPGKRLGWLEDLPRGVALEWACRRPRFERSHPAAERAEVLGRMAAVRADILAVSLSDDDFGTLAAMRRGLGYYQGAARMLVSLAPADYGQRAIGHFGLFHDRHRDGFWRDSLRWLSAGVNPWPDHVAESWPPAPDPDDTARP